MKNKHSMSNEPKEKTSLSQGPQGQDKFDKKNASSQKGKESSSQQETKKQAPKAEK